MKRNEKIIMGLVRKVIKAIQKETAAFVAEVKIGYDGMNTDIVTSADKLAQDIYVQGLMKHFPGYGIIAEEGFNLEPAPEAQGKYFIIDPLDGTKAYARGQSHGVGTMIALVQGNEVIASFIGDINTGEIYGYYGNGPVTRTRFGTTAAIGNVPTLPLEKQVVLLDDPDHYFPPVIEQMIRKEGFFKKQEVSGGGIGTNMARLWKGEIGALFLGPWHNIPWDQTPVVGINRKLGFVEIKYTEETGARLADPVLSKVVLPPDGWTLVVHKDNAPGVLAWFEEQV